MSMAKIQRTSARLLPRLKLPEWPAVLQGRQSVAARRLDQAMAAFRDQARHESLARPTYRMGYSLWGEGPVVVLCPGMCSPRTLLAPLAAELSRWCRVVCYDLPGVHPGDGSTASALRRYRPEHYTADLHALVDHVADGPVALVGLSFGGANALRLAVRAAQAVRRLVTVGSFLHRPLTTWERVQTWLVGRLPGSVDMIPGMNRLSRRLHQGLLDRRDPRLIELLLTHGNGIPLRTCAAQAAAIDRTDLRGDAPQVRVPTLVVHGRQDKLVDPATAARTAALVPGAELLMLDRCGHLPHLSMPEVLAGHLRRFLGT